MQLNLVLKNELKQLFTKKNLLILSGLLFLNLFMEYIYYKLFAVGSNLASVTYISLPTFCIITPLSFVICGVAFVLSNQLVIQKIHNGSWSLELLFLKNLKQVIWLKYLAVSIVSLLYILVELIISIAFFLIWKNCFFDSKEIVIMLIYSICLLFLISCIFAFQIISKNYVITILLTLIMYLLPAIIALPDYLTAVIPYINIGNIIKLNATLIGIVLTIGENIIASLLVVGIGIRWYKKVN